MDVEESAVRKARLLVLLLSLGASFSAFWCGRLYERQAHHLPGRIACDIPTTRSEALYLWVGADGELLCQRKGALYGNYNR